MCTYTYIEEAIYFTEFTNSNANLILKHPEIMFNQGTSEVDA